jgi:DNA/RNA-binding domain of Phe-tRNA-synthetase-like protein
MKLIIHQRIKEVIPNCRLAYILFEDVTVRGTPLALFQEFFSLQAEVAKIYKIDILSSIPRMAAVRNMYKKLDFDPSRYRPSSEALVRRILQKKEIYYANSAVDVNNYCSIKFLLPFGVYDFSKITGDVVYDFAKAGSYINIAGRTISTDDKPFLSDECGVFGNPTADAGRTAVKLTTNKLLLVIYTDEEVTNEELQDMLDFTAEMMVLYNGGAAVVKNIVHA